MTSTNISSKNPESIAHLLCPKCGYYLENYRSSLMPQCICIPEGTTVSRLPAGFSAYVDEQHQKARDLEGGEQT